MFISGDDTKLTRDVALVDIISDFLSDTRYALILINVANITYDLFELLEIELS